MVSRRKKGFPDPKLCGLKDLEPTRKRRHSQNGESMGKGGTLT